jgi:hypothetical protein
MNGVGASAVYRFKQVHNDVSLRRLQAGGDAQNITTVTRMSR